MGKEIDEDDDKWDFMVDEPPSQRRVTTRNLSSRHISQKRPLSLAPNHTLLSEKADIGSIDANTTSVHLSKQDVINIRTIQFILKTCPNLHIVEIGEAEYDRLVGPGIKRLLLERGIEIRRCNLKQREPEENVRETPRYLKEREAYRRMLNNPEKSPIYQKMQEYEMDEVEIAEGHFGSDAQSLRNISLKMGLPERYVQRKFSGFTLFLGIDSNDARAKYIESLKNDYKNGGK